jgi:Protein of unknown function (DUF1553)/Protein of unknown function (DUF1549)/Planctomycete cytochrome C/NedA-like, galactose-binding domain
MRSSTSILAFAVVLTVPLTVAAEEGRKIAPKTVDYNRHIRPILSKYCFACHGRDEKHREAGLRLDQRDVATKKLESGETAVVPGKPAASELLRRVTSTDSSIRMPPAETKRRVSAKEVELLRRWIAGGAKYARHWAFIKPVRPEIPQVRTQGFPKSLGSEYLRNPIDNFIISRLNESGLKPSPEADRYTLIRRLSFDLRGIPPTPAEVRRFMADTRPGAYSRLVDRFLKDPRFGERWARVWLDLARYADSAGYGSDPLRQNIWRYRDWVIGAFNRNLPYDEFTIEQLAGDLLPNATLDQKIATAFHRNTMTNTEGGTDDEEFRVAAVRDRVDTTIQVWMGLTMGCAKCHSHKYDPIKQKEYYGFYAIFNQTADNDQPSEAPVIDAPRRQDFEAIQQVERRVVELRRQLRAGSPQLQAEQRAWEQRFRNADDKPPQARFVRIELPGRKKLLSLAEVQVFHGGINIAKGRKARQSSTDYNGRARLAVDGNTNGDFFKAKSTTHTKVERNPWWEVDLAKPAAIDKVVVWNRTDGGLHKRLVNFRLLLLDEKRNSVWQRTVKMPPNPSSAFAPGGVRSTVSAEILAIVDSKPEQRTAKQQAALREHFRSIAPSLKKLRDEIARLEKSKPKFPTVPVMQELPRDRRRKTFVMIRGSFLQKGDAVQPGVPQAFHPFPKGAPKNRLGVAEWIMHPDNPLTARVAVNRLWARIFGTGIVETEEDFGTQGELPSHPELLDWLAVEFRESGWDMKRFLKLLVTSATYRQSSAVGQAFQPDRKDQTTSNAQEAPGQAGKPDLRDVDPRNRLLSRAPRIRLEAEMVRDQALALSGLLSQKMDGPSVYPPQPPGLWRAAFNGQRTWPTSKGEDKYRRGLYTFWRRTVPYPSMATFDAPSREICTVRRIRTNTPLQAFVTLNDPVYVEAAQSLARRIIREGGGSVESRVRFALFLCLVHPPSSSQVAALTRLYRSELTHYQPDKTAAKKLAGDPTGPGTDVSELAAWTVVSNVLLNLDAVLTRK